MATYTNIPASATSLNRASYTNIPSSSSFSPDSVSNLELWLKADTLSGNDGDAVTTWTKSGGTSGVSPTQGTAGNRPLLKKGVNGINNLAVVRFDGTDDYLLGTHDAGSTGWTLFVVGRTGAALSSYGGLVASGGNAGYDNRTTGIWWHFAYGSAVDTFGAGWAGATGAVALGNVTGAAINTTFRFRYKYDKVNWSISGPNSGTPADTSFPTATFQTYLGAGGTSGGGAVQNAFNGDLGEILIYSRALTAGEITSIDAYLLARWGV